MNEGRKKVFKIMVAGGGGGGGQGGGEWGEYSFRTATHQ